MTTDELINALERMESETGSLADSLCCLGCGHEHNCGVYGCAIIREAVEHLNARRWIYVKEKLPEGGKRVIVARKNGKVGRARNLGDAHGVHRDAQVAGVRRSGQYRRA